MADNTTVTVTDDANAVTAPATGDNATAIVEARTPEQTRNELDSANARILELNKENERNRRKQSEFEAAQKKADEDRLAKQGEFETLAKTREGERDTAQSELESAKAQIQRFTEIVSGDLNKRIEKWPDAVKNLVPKADGVDALTRLERIQELEPLALQLMTAPAVGGLRPGPVSNGVAALTLDDLKKLKMKSSEYPTF